MRKWTFGLVLLAMSGCAIGVDSELVSVSSHISKKDGVIDTENTYITLDGKHSNIITIKFDSREQCELFKNAINREMDGITREVPPDSPKGAQRP